MKEQQMQLKAFNESCFSVEKQLRSMQDTEYRDFHASLIPTVDKSRIIGVRIPLIRKLARELSGTMCVKSFLNSLPHYYYDENCLHAFLIENIDNFDECIEYLEKFLPYIDNWAVCDTLNPKAFFKNRLRLIEYVRKWITSSETYTVRYAIGVLMRHYLDDIEYLDLVAAVKSEEYYVKTMVAWYFATALAKHYDEAVLYLTERRLDAWVHNKTVQKAMESNRISKGQKEALRKLKIR